tara:strand:+ start:923 stop:1108 length:186 start_codon:yes stop_codon:yes gene_type:complete
MDDLIDLIATDASANDVSDRIKDMLYAKSAGRIDGMKPDIANTVFAEPVESEEPTEQEQEE